MTQPATWGVPTTGPASPSTMASRMQDSLDGLLSNNADAGAPPYAVAGTSWVRQASGTEWIFQLNDGIDWNPIFTLNPTTGALSLPVVTVGNASAGGHALNRTTADARYGMLGAANPWSGVQSFADQLRGKDGTAASPSYAFTIEPGSGMFFDDANSRVSFSKSGTIRGYYSSTEWNFSSPVNVSGQIAGTGGVSISGGTTTINSANNVAINFRTIITGDGTSTDCLRLNRTSNGGAPFTYMFVQNAGVTTGSISYNGTNTLYNATSDYRLKEEIADLAGGIDFIMALRPRRFRMKDSGLFTSGFIAHEFAEVSPSSVSGERDATDEDGAPIYQAMQASSPEVMANLVAAIQELVAENADLKARVAALEGA